MRKLIVFIIIGGLVLSCSDPQTTENLKKELALIKKERDSLLNIVKQNKLSSSNEVISFLTFQKANAEEAMNFYVELFDNSKITSIRRHGKDSPAEGTILMATFELNGSKFACSDSYIKHEWTFTPAFSIYVELESEEKLIEVYNKLSKEGNVLMPLNNYGFSKKFGFVEDKFGVSWQLNFN